MKYFVPMLFAIGLVIMMAGPGDRKIRMGESILVVIVGAIIAALIFGFVVSQTLN